MSRVRNQAIRAMDRERGEHSPPGKWNQLLLVLAAAAIFVDTTFFTVLTPLIPHYRDAGVGEAGIGALSASYALGSLAFALPAGFLAVRHGPRQVVLVGLFGMAATSVLFGASASAALRLSSRITQGAFGAMVWSGALTWLIEGSPPSRKGEAIGAATGVGIFGALVGPTIGAAAALTTPPLIFSSLAGLCVVLFVWAAAMPSYSRNVSVLRTRAIRQMLQSRAVRRSLFLFTAPAVCFGVLAVVVPLRINYLGGGAILIAVAYTGSAAVEGASAPFSGRWSDTVGRFRPYALGIAVCGLASLGIFVAPSPLLVVVGVFGASLGAGLCSTPAFVLLSDSAAGNATHQGIAVSVANLGWSAGQAVGGFGAGVLTTVGGSRVPVGLAVGVLLVALFMVIGQPFRCKATTAHFQCLPNSQV